LLFSQKAAEEGKMIAKSNLHLISKAEHLFEKIILSLYLLRNKM